MRAWRRCLHISREVSQALAAGRPVVCLESTIVTHGMPYPRNLEMARQVEQVVRRGGGVPATIAILDGEPRVGLDEGALERLAKTGTRARKISRRDMAACVAERATGGTTVSATMILARKAGIRVFVTGGIGGVHRNGESTMDVSNDLQELARNEVAVVCAGPKAILDIPRTLEYLETMGVTVTTVGQRNLPAFYSRDSGLKSPHVSPDAAHVAQLIAANRTLGLGSSTLVCVPCPAEAALGKAFMDRVIEYALSDAEAQSIGGKDTTPFLLQAVSEATQGRSLAANIALVLENARVGTEIAVRLAELEGGAPPPARDEAIREAAQLQGARVEADLPQTRSKVDVAVVGSLAIDLTCDVEGAKTKQVGDLLDTSSPGKIQRTVGGVGANIARAAAATGSSAALISAIGNDIDGQYALRSLDTLSTDHVLQIEDGTTATYCCVQLGGKLVLAVADMHIAEQLSPEHIAESLNELKPLWVVCDANLSVAALDAALETAQSLGASVLYEPVSVSKSARLFDTALTCSPSHKVDCITPNIHELGALFAAARRRADQDSALAARWWAVIDALSIDSRFRLACEQLFMRNRRELSGLEAAGAIQQCIHLLPYTPNVYLTMGKAGVLSVHLTTADAVAGMPHEETRSLTWTGRATQALREAPAITIEYHPAEAQREQEFTSDTGAGDTFAGALVTALSAGHGVGNREAVRYAQRCAIESLKTAEAVASSLPQLRQA